MPALVSIDDIVDRAFVAAEMDTGGPVTSTEMNGYANAELSSLYDQIIDAYDGNYNVKRGTVQTTQTGFIDLAADLPDFYKLWKLWTTLPSGQLVEVKPFQREQRALLKTASSVGGGAWPLRYMLVGNEMEVLPVTSTAYTIECWYIPTFTPLTIGQSPVQKFDAVQFGWEEAAVLGAAIRAVRKERGNVAVLMQQQQEAKGRIRHMATPRDTAEPMYVARVEDYSDHDPDLYRGRPDRIW